MKLWALKMIGTKDEFKADGSGCPILYSSEDEANYHLQNVLNMENWEIVCIVRLVVEGENE